MTFGWQSKNVDVIPILPWRKPIPLCCLSLIMTGGVKAPEVWVLGRQKCLFWALIWKTLGTDNTVLLTLCRQFVFIPLLFQHDPAQSQIRKEIRKIALKKLESLNLKTIKKPHCEAGPIATSVLDFTNVLWMNWSKSPQPGSNIQWEAKERRLLPSFIWNLFVKTCEDRNSQYSNRLWIHIWSALTNVSLFWGLTENDLSIKR